MKKYIIVFLLLLFGRSEAQLQNLLGALGKDSVGVLLNNPTDTTPFYDGIFLKLAASTDSIMSSLQHYGRSQGNYTSVTSAKNAAKGLIGPGILWSTQHDRYADSTYSWTTGDSVTIFRVWGDTLFIYGNVRFEDGKSTFENAISATRLIQDWDDIISWEADGTNSPDRVQINLRERIYEFDTAVAETLWGSMRLYTTWNALDSIEIRVSVASTSGDSVAFRFGYIAIATGEDTGGDSYTVLADTIDLGTSSGFLRSMKITSGITGLTAGDRIIMFLTRDGTIANDETGDVRVHETITYHKIDQ